MSELSITADPRPLGKSGLAVFPIAYGMWRFAGTDAKAARAKIDAALETGMTLFDTADIYGIDDGLPVGASEELFGAALRLDPSVRDKMVIATKAGINPGVPYESGEAYVTAACEASLGRIGIDRIDLYQIHRPDLLAHPEAVATTLTKLKDQGKIAHVGVSNHTAAQFEALQSHLDFPIATHQPEFSAWVLEPIWNGVLDQCMARGVTPLAWSALAGGKLALSRGDAAKYDPRLATLVDSLDALAERQDVTREAVALAFLLAHPAGVIPIIGTQNVERIKGAAAAFKVRLGKSDWYDIVEAAQGEALP